MTTPLWKALLFERRLPWRYVKSLKKLKDFFLTHFSLIPLGGGSRNSLDEYAKKQIKEIKPKTIIDFGAGRGKYGIIIREIYGNKVNVKAIDIFKKTVKYLKKRDIYNEVINADILNWLKNNKKKYDLAIFGDVLEHLEKDEIYQVIPLTLKQFNDIIVQVPLYKCKQGSVGGNIHEEHKTIVTPDFFNKFPIKEKNIKQTKELAEKGYKVYDMNLWISKR